MLADRLTPDARITVMTGAGVSAASGVPTFRGAGGLWKQFKPESLATAEAFERDPKLVWEWYDWRRQKIAACEPNAAHRVLAKWSARFPHFNLITQNVDGLHERAALVGASLQACPKDPIRLHGSIWEVQCWDRCGKSPSRWRDETAPYTRIPPTCPHCGGLIRPGVVWFGEALDPEIIGRASAAAAECDVFLTIGTSSVVYPAASFVDHARANGAFTVEINPEATPASGAVDLVLRGPAEEILEEIDGQLQADRTPPRGRER